MKSLLVALQFLTPIPLKLNSVKPEDLSRSMRYFPLIGLLIGLFLVLLKIVSFGPLNFSAMVTATLLLLALTALSGGLHLDGLSDMCDGFYAGRSREDIIKIMRDPHTGVMGVVGIFLVLILKWSVLVSLPLNMPYYSSIALIMTPVLSRWAMVITAFASPYAPAASEGTARPFIENLTRRDASISTAVMLLVVFMLCIISGNYLWLLALVVPIIVAITIVMVSRRILGGITGDVLGAVNEITEVAVLFGAYIIYLGR